MRTMVITCDRCGRTIEGYPVKIIVESVDRQTGEFLTEADNRETEGQEKTSDMDFCVECSRKIIRFAKGGMKENPEFKKAVEEMVDAPEKAKKKEKQFRHR